MTQPPLTSTVAPVMKLAPSLARKSTTLATSDGSTDSGSLSGWVDLFEISGVMHHHFAESTGMKSTRFGNLAVADFHQCPAIFVIAA